MKIEIHYVYQNGRTKTAAALLTDKKIKALKPIGHIDQNFPALPFDYDHISDPKYNTLFRVYDNKKDGTGKMDFGKYHAWLTPFQRYGLILMFGKAWFQDKNNLWKIVRAIGGLIGFFITIYFTIIKQSG